MKTMINTTVRLLCAVTLLLPANIALKAQSDEPLESDNAVGALDKNIVLYQGPLVHDQQWVITAGTTKTDILGGFGGTCSLVPSNVKNVSAREHVRFDSVRAKSLCGGRAGRNGHGDAGVFRWDVVDEKAKP